MVSVLLPLPPELLPIVPAEEPLDPLVEGLVDVPPLLPLFIWPGVVELPLLPVPPYELPPELDWAKAPVP